MATIRMPEQLNDERPAMVHIEYGLSGCQVVDIDQVCDLHDLLHLVVRCLQGLGYSEDCVYEAFRELGGEHD